MPHFEFTGTVKVVQPVQSFASGFTKREIVVTSEEDRFPQDIPFEFVKDKAGLLDGIKEADRVKVTFDLRGREYNGKYYLNASGWKIEKVDGSMPGAGAGTAPAGTDLVPDDLADGMPF